MSMRYAIVFIVLLTAACSLEMSQPPVPTQQASAPTLPVATTTPQPTVTVVPTQVVPTSTVSAPTCVLRSDWTAVYTIVAGDTLSSIARRVNSSVSELAAANCIADPSVISSGQQIRLPFLPTSTTTGLPLTYSNAALGFAVDYQDFMALVESDYYVGFAAPENGFIEILFSEPGNATLPADAAADCKRTSACFGDRTLLGESAFTLPSGLSAYQLTLSGSPKNADGTALYTFVRVGSRLLTVRGFDDLSFYYEILNTLRPA